MVQETSAMVPSAVHLLAALFGVVDSHFHGGYTYDQPLVPSTERDNASTYTKQLSGDQCVASYGASQFRLQSPRFPAPYPPGLQCIYVVEAVSTDICLLQATFLTFDLGDCESGDHVIIAGQRLCGSVNGVQTFRFGRPRSLILFRTGAAEGQKGFDIAVRQVPCPLTSVPHRECSANFSGRSFVLQSTGYPASYPGNVHCQYVIRAAGPSPQQSLCQAAFSFESFNVDSSEGCSRDRLEIGDQDVLCGFFNGVRTYEFVGELRAHFYSDDFGNQGGYRISVVQQGCRILNLLPSGGVDPVPPTPVSPPFHLPLCCGKVYSGHQFFLASPGFPFNHANQDTDCVYEIHPSSPGVCKLRILFKFFRVGQEESYGVCSGGFLEIDGRQYCGCVLGLTVTSAFDDQGSGRQKALRYRNVANSGGFLLEVFQEDCTGFPAWVRQDTSGQFQQHYKTTSPYYSVNVGISNSSSSAIMADTRTEEQKTFRDPTSDSNANRSDGRYFRTLEQAPRVSGYPRETDGTGDKSLVFAVGATDRNKSPAVQESDVKSADSKMQQKSAVDNETSADKQRVWSSLQENSDKQIYELNFVRAGSSVGDGTPLSPSADSDKNTNKQDYLSLSRSNSGESRDCGLDGGNCIRWDTPRERRDPVSDGLWSIRETACRAWGLALWLLQGKQHLWSSVHPELPSLAPRCQVFGQATGWIQSPGYPRAYPSNLRHCYRFLRLSGYCEVHLFVTDFSLEPSENCVKDYLLFGGQWRYCGESLSSTGTVLDMSVIPYLDLVFVSDSQYSGRGFRALYRHVPCARRVETPRADCGLVTNRENFTLAGSGNTSQDSCVYRISRHSTAVCSLQLALSTFNLVCGEEHVQIGDHFYCGPLSGRSVEVDFLKPEIRIVYRRTGRRGQGNFLIDGQQLQNCDFGLSDVPLAARVSNSSTRCDIQLSEMRGFAVCPKPQLSSSQPAACSYVIRPQKGMCAVRLEFGSFHVPSEGDNCTSGFLELQRRRFCEDQLDHRSTVVDFDGRAYRVPFYFARGSPGTPQWNFTYSQLPCPEPAMKGTA